MCPDCRQPLAACGCRAAAQARAAQAAAGDGTVRVGRETGGRGGKVVSVVRGVPLAGEALAALAKRLRSACGTGGTVKEGVIELQGEHRDRLVALLAAEGFRVKRVGG
jgi:translation initiation factor 1